MTTTISATATVRVRGGMDSPEAAAAIATALGSMLGGTFAATPTIVAETRPRPSGERA